MSKHDVLAGAWYEPNASWNSSTSNKLDECVWVKYCENDVKMTFDLAMMTNAKKTMEIKNVIFNDPATIVFWNDGTKTVVKTQDGEKYDPEKGLAMAISKKALGNKGSYYNTFDKWLKKYEDDCRVAHDLMDWFKQAINSALIFTQEMDSK